MVTLDIEDNAIKLMVVRGRQVEMVASLPLEDGLIHDGVIIDPPTVGRRIGELLAMHGIGEKRVMVSISGMHSIYRAVNVPKLSKRLLEQAAQEEMERAMPVPLNELYTSWQAIDLSEIETAICLVGMPRNTVDAALETLRQAGLQPEVMDVRPLALARVTDERDALVINAQPVGFDIVAVINGIPELLRSMPYPDETASPDEKVAEVKEELDRTIAFYNSSHKGAEITNRMAAFVSGELGDMLAQTLEYRVKPLPQLLSYADGLNVSEYAANIGLALGQTKAEAGTARVNLNITPEAYQPKAFPIIQFISWAFILVAILVLILFGISTFQAYTQNIGLTTQVRNIQTQIEKSMTTQTSVKQLQAQIDAARKDSAVFVQALNTAKTQRATINNALSTTTSLIPGIIQLQSIAYNQGTITVSGIAPDDTIVVDYVRDLTNSGQFSSVLISSMSEGELNEWPFTLTIKAKTAQTTTTK
jgi:Tfp pilus assembly protein PilN